MVADTVGDGIFIGAAGGAAAGVIIWLIDRLRDCELEWREGRRILQWLEAVSAREDALKWRSTRAIASYNNLTEDRVRYVCSRHERIVLSTGNSEVWAIKGRARDMDHSGVVPRGTT
ncbi:MAG: hypothetical protein K8J08_13715 [Thermoanaerobaculia bacterium]|nr:hypothetical protein [Thermoanaerobaculia bacterium]